MAVLAALLALGCGIALAEQDESNGSPVDPALSAPPSSEPGPEVVADRTANSETFRLPGGELETRIFANPINYLDSDGNWQPIEEGLEEQPDGSGLTNGTNSFDVDLPERLGAGPVRLSSEGNWISTELLGTELKLAQLEDETATYESSSGDTAFEFSSLANGLKEDIEIASTSAPSVFHFAIDASAGITPTLAEDGSVEFRDESGEPVAILPAPTMSDSTPGDPVVSRDVHYSLDPQGDHWTLTVEADRKWLEAPDRVLPVRIDPTVTVKSPTLDCEIGGKTGQSGWGLCGSGGQKTLTLAYKPQLESSKDEWSRALLRYTLGSLPTDSYIASASFTAQAPVAAQNTSGVELLQTTKSWTKEANWKRYNYDAGHKTEYPWSTEGGDYSTLLGTVLTSERGTQAGSWAIPVAASVVEELAPKMVNGHKVEGSLSFIAKLIDDKSRECSKTSCTQRVLGFESSAAPNENNRPSLSVVYYLKAPSESKLTLPSEGTVTSRRLKLQSAFGVGVKSATYQFREGKSGRFETIPTSLVRNAEGKEVKWPIVPGEGISKTETLYFDAAHATSALRSHGGALQVRALFDGSEGTAGYSVPVNATVNRFVGGPVDATASVGPGSVDLLTGNFTVGRTDVSIPGFGSALEFSRTHSSRDAGAAGKEGVLGQGWKPGVSVEEAGGAEWRSVREFVASAEEKAEGLGDYAVLTDLEGYEYAFEKTGEKTYATPPELTGLTLVRETGEFKLTDSDGNQTVFKNTEGGTEYLPTSITQTGGSTNSTQMVYELVSGKRRLKMIIAPTATGIACSESTAKTTVGCRALSFKYFGGGGHEGEPPGPRLASITYYGPSGANSMSSWEVAHYAYNSEGRLTEEWDPRISPNLKETYAYEAGGQLKTITPPGQEPWTMEYGTADEEEANGRLMNVKRASLVASPSTAKTTIAYGVPLTSSKVGPMKCAGPMSPNGARKTCPRTPRRSSRLTKNPPAHPRAMPTPPSITWTPKARP